LTTEVLTKETLEKMDYYELLILAVRFLENNDGTKEQRELLLNELDKKSNGDDRELIGALRSCLLER